MRAIVAHSEDPETEDAIAEILASCEQQLGGEQPKGALLFMSVDYDHSAVLQAVQARWPELPLIGGSTDGELSSELGFVDDSMVLTLLTGDGIRVRAGLGTDLVTQPDAAVQRCAESLGGAKAKVCITVFSPGANSTAVIEDLEQSLNNKACPILGGLTGDHRGFSRTAEFFGGDVHTGSLAALTIEGDDLVLGWGIGSGWLPLGETIQVTQSEGHLVSTINSQPALGFYEQHWGELKSGSRSLGEYPLAVFPDGRDGPHFLRAAMESDTETGTISFAGDVPQGAVVSVTEVLPEGILSGSAESVAHAIEAYEGGQPALALVFTCAARKWVLGTRAAEEIDLLKGSFAKTKMEALPLAGFYCYGEIAPFVKDGPTRFHNETCVTLLIGT